jgi:hyperosmotically inducible periplasmic protein
MKSKLQKSHSENKRVKSLASTIALCGLLTGAAFANAAEQQKTMEEHVKDGWKEGKVETLFLLNPHLNNFKIDADVEGNTMVLEGVVNEAIDRDLAEAIAYNIDGVARVENRIVVDPESKTTNQDIENVKQEVSDLKLLTMVKTKLVKNPHIAGFSIDVDADHGKITLSGVVGSEATRELAKWLAMSTDGVVDVDNKLVVKASQES